MPRRLLPLLALALILAAACAGQSAPTAAAPQPGTAQRDGFAYGGAADTKGVATAPEGVPAGQGIPSLANATRDLIISANITMRSTDPWATADAARGIAASLGGDLLGLSQSGTGDRRSASVVMRVPSSRVDDALTQLKKLDGEVLTSSVDAKDVTDQFVDVQARLAAKKAEEQQYLTLLGRANTVDEVLKVQSALWSVRMQVEQLQAQVNSMKDRIDYSTISMSITPIAPVVGEPAGTWDPARTFAKALAALTVLVRGLADLAIWALVFIWVPLLALGVTLLAARARRSIPTA